MRRKIGRTSRGKQEREVRVEKVCSIMWKDTKMCRGIYGKGKADLSKWMSIS